MLARYRSKCKVCKKPIRIGQDIVSIRWGLTVHAPCSPPLPPARDTDPRTEAKLEAAERSGFR